MLPGEYSTYTAATGVPQCTHIIDAFAFGPSLSSFGFFIWRGFLARLLARSPSLVILNFRKAAIARTAGPQGEVDASKIDQRREFASV